MAYPLALNTDKFLTGGVMDAPDLQVRTAMNKLAWGMPITSKEAQRITQRQGLEQQSINAAQKAAEFEQMRQGSPIDVRSYTGSMWASQGSAMAAKPIEGYVAPKRYNPEATANTILNQNFGGFQPGSLQVAYGGSREGQSEVVPPEMLVPAGYGDNVPEAPVGIPSAPALNALIGGGQAIQTIMPSGVNVGQKIQPIQALGQTTGTQYPAQGKPIDRFASPYPSGSALAMTTPRDLENKVRMANYDLRVQKQQQEAAHKQGEDVVKSLAARHAMNEDISSGLGLTEDTNLIARATTQGRELKNKIRSGEVREQEFVDGDTVYKALVNVNTGRNEGPIVPVRSTQRLPGSEPMPKASGQLTPVMNPVTKKPFEDVFYDPVTKSYVHTGQMGSAASVLNALGFGGVAPQQTTGQANNPPAGWTVVK